MASKDPLVLMLRVCAHVTLHGKRELEDVMTLSMLRWGDDPGLFGGAQCHHKAFYA